MTFQEKFHWVCGQLAGVGFLVGFLWWTYILFRKEK